MSSLGEGMHVVLSFTDKHLVMNSKNLPNHPVAVFPERT